MLRLGSVGWWCRPFVSKRWVTVFVCTCVFPPCMLIGRVVAWACMTWNCLSWHGHTYDTEAVCRSMGMHDTEAVCRGMGMHDMELSVVAWAYI